MSDPYIPGLEALAQAIEGQGSRAPDDLPHARLFATELADRLGWDRAGLDDFEVAAMLLRSLAESLTGYQLTSELGNSLDVSETLSAFDARLRGAIDYDCMAVYRVEEKQFLPAYVNGEKLDVLCSHSVRWGQGACGVAASRRQPVLDREAGFVLAIPLESADEVIAVLLLHRASAAFTNHELRILLGVQAKLAVAVEHALRTERAEQLATADPLTGLPNRRALFQRLDAELARCRRSHGTLALLVCEIDGLERRLSKPVAAGLRRLCREDDCVARMGENFVLALGNFSARDLPEKLRLIEAVLAELDPSGSLIARTGAAYYPDDGAYAEDLLACAELRSLQSEPRT